MMYPSVASTDLHASFGNEPMTLGSPSSPTGHPSQYLPGYLLGDPAPLVTSPGHKMWSAGSPPRSQTRNLTSPTSANSMLGSHKDKGGAPPIKSLFDTVGSPSAAVSSPFSRHMTMTQGPGGSFMGSPAPPTTGLSKSFNSSALASDSMTYSANQSRISQSPAQIDPFYTQGEALSTDDVLDETWVTVFGFPPSATSYVLQQFSQYGNILKHVTSSDGNWMHLHYQSKIQAKKALSKHGKVFGGNIMVGVTPCIDKTVMVEEEKENRSMSQLSFMQTPGTPSTSYVDSPAMNSSRYSAIRPLTATYKAVRSENEVLPAGHAPQKSNSFISKTMEYVFGW
ncbi:nucleoporin NUP35-like [Liolophura sinensis]|uniref:nucleoporin NUP35-like n=1 Tax=Liolophura sinensis TaxID=3198878 RepID=UPI003158F652